MACYTVNVCSTEELQSVQRHDHQIPIIFQKLTTIDSQLTGCGSQGWLSDRYCLSLSKDCSLGMRVATIPGRARSCSLGLVGAATGKGLSCCSPSSCGWLLAVLGDSDTREALGETRLGRTCFLFLVIPELPLALGCALSTLACTSCNNDDDDDSHMVQKMTLVLYINHYTNNCYYHTGSLHRINGFHYSQGVILKCPSSRSLRF